MASEKDITELLIDSRKGGVEAMNEIFALVYHELRLIAKGQLNKLMPVETLNATALVNELYLKLIDRTRTEFKDRVHFFSVAAIAMRRIIINYARAKAAERRGGKLKREGMDAALNAVEDQAKALIELDEPLEKLREHDERQSQVIELHFFIGMSIMEIAELLGVSTKTVQRDMIKAKAYIANVLNEE